MTTKAKKDYSQGKIYKIEPTVEHDEGDIYIGSTTNRLLCQRMGKHRDGYNNWKKGKTTRAMSYCLFEKYGMETCVIILLENVNATNYDELASREAHYIKSLKCVNKQIPLRTDIEYRKDNEQKIKENKKIYRQNNRDLLKIKDHNYYEANKEIIREKQNEYNKINEDKIKDYRKQHYEENKQDILDYQKQYREENAQKIKDYKKQYREENRDKINEKQRLAHQKKKQEKESLGNV